ncbi:uncharacterized protein LOC114250350 [Bombyx mandarina]|uniref:Uncharacterized protein LOC114250350 n=1 Tax=Bombyx mandarina TaxID=7092 RepID=A0A6J2KCG2_BOMMA|nr:uncharacterized protein LOC114250350 [Bombyx mandarina]
MNQYHTERRLCICYSLLAGLLTISIVCIAIPYNHWRVSLDMCPGNFLENISCGCILNGVFTSQSFNGGHNSYCLYAIFAPIPVIVYAIVMALFHMYRVCINNIGKYEDEKTTEMEEIEGRSIVVTSRSQVTDSNDSVIYCWIPTSCLAAILCLYNLVHAIITTDGYFRTCTQYRGALVRDLRQSGSSAIAIHFRLNCQAIFDFMDYVHNDSQNSRRGDYINTGASLQLALFATWASVVLWIVIVVFTALRAYRERHVLTCCGN